MRGTLVPPVASITLTTAWIMQLFIIVLLNAETVDNGQSDRMMVHNPIYDPASGPEYECVDTLLQLNSGASPTSDDSPTTLSSSSNCTTPNHGKAKTKSGESDDYTMMTPTELSSKMLSLSASGSDHKGMTSIKSFSGKA